MSPAAVISAALLSSSVAKPSIVYCVVAKAFGDRRHTNKIVKGSALAFCEADRIRKNEHAVIYTQRKSVVSTATRNGPNNVSTVSQLNHANNNGKQKQDLLN